MLSSALRLGFRTRGGDRSIRSDHAALLLVGSTYTYGGRQFDMRGSIDDVLAGLPDVIGVVVIGDASDPRHHSWSSWVSDSPTLVLTHRSSIASVGFDHPGFILFSSGTTGAPKCIVHSAAGVLLKDLVSSASISTSHRVIVSATTPPPGG